MIQATACFIEEIHFVFGKITPVFSHEVSASKTQLVFGSIFRKLAMSFCSTILSTTSMMICLVLDSCFFNIQLYKRFIISSKVLSVVKTPLEIRRFHLLSKSEKKSQILSSGLYLL
ncbi:hypothetical protein IKI14_04955 [bacterium]|nr:hypothetical protein [bacterium]